MRAVDIDQRVPAWHLDPAPARQQRCDGAEPGIGLTGNPTVGAYLIELQLFSDATDGNDTPSYRDADPVKVILNHGLIAEECSSAIEALIRRDPTVAQPPTPASGVLIIGGE